MPHRHFSLLSQGIRAAVAALLLAFPLCGPAQAQYFALGKGQAPLQPYDIDYSNLADPAKRTDPLDAIHYIPLGTGAYATLGGEIREQFWSRQNDAYALRTPISNTYDLQRVIVNAYVHFDPHFAVFAQIGRFDSFDRINPSTTDRDYGRVQQGFVELKEPFGSANVTARAGRQEITLGSGRFVWINDSSNVRTTHDGVHVHVAFAGGSEADALYTRPVTPQLEPFDDFDTHAGAFAAAYFSQPLLYEKLHVDEYYYYRRNLGGQYSGLTGNEDRHTIGGRVWGEFGPLLYDADFAYQFGTFEAKPISAFGGSARTLYTFTQLPLQPGLQLQGSYFSGGGGTDSQTIRTFAAPFPRPTMLNYIGLNTLENLIEAYPAVVITPFRDVAFRFGPEFVWRASVDDAVYISRTTPLAGTMSATDKASFIGTNLFATLQWRPVRNVNIFAEYLHELPGPAITLAGGKSVDAGVVQVSYRF